MVDSPLPIWPFPSKMSTIQRCSCCCNVLSARASVLSSGGPRVGGESLSSDSIDPLAETVSPGLRFWAACPKLPAWSPRTTLSGREGGATYGGRGSRNSESNLYTPMFDRSYGGERGRSSCDRHGTAPGRDMISEGVVVPEDEGKLPRCPDEPPKGELGSPPLGSKKESVAGGDVYCGDPTEPDVPCSDGPPKLLGGCLCDEGVGRRLGDAPAWKIGGRVRGEDDGLLRYWLRKLSMLFDPAESGSRCCIGGICVARAGVSRPSQPTIQLGGTG
jgi:hypothetical protein